MRWYLHTSFRLLSVALAIAVPLAGSRSLAAEQTDVLLHRQSPNRFSGYYADTAYLDDAGSLSAQLVADRFVISQNSNACRLAWWGFFGGIAPLVDPPPPVSEKMQVTIYEELGGLPGTVLYQQEFLNLARVWTGSFVGLGPLRREYRYDVTLSECVPIEAAKPYWIQIAQTNKDPDSLFRWESSNGGEFAVRFPIDSPYRLITNLGQLSYELTTPEPCSGALLALAFARLLKRRAR